jgi:glycosyltransferase involved in cell wall biosynthesis
VVSHLTAINGLIKTIKSVEKQVFNDYEHIIIDGKSTDGSAEWLNKLNANNIIIKSEKDEGIYDAMNKGIKIASGRYLLFLNSGDILLNNSSLIKLYKKVIKMKSNAKVYYWDLLTSKGIWYFPHKGILKHFVNSFIGHSGAALFEHNIFNTIGLYDKAYKLHADRELYYKIFSTFGEESFHKINGYYSIFELGGGENTNKFRGTQSKAEKRMIELKHDEIFKSNFENYNYQLTLSYPTKLKIMILKPNDTMA